MDKIEEYYNKFNEEKRLDSRHGQVEYIVTMKYVHEAIENIMKANAYKDKGELKLLDIGAGTGRYSVPLSHEGYDVTAVELVKYNLGVLKKKGSRVNALQGNALNLKKLADNTYDVTLLFGPMYHLFTLEDKVKALSEAKRVTKEGGYILVAYVMNEYAFIRYAIMENNLSECIEKSLISEDFHTLTNEDSLYDYVRLEDIETYNEMADLKREKIISPDGPFNYIRYYVNRLSQKDFEKLVEYQLKTCERMDIIGAAAHTVDILRK